MTRPATLFLILAGATALSGCGTIGQLKTIGKAPKLSEMTAVDTPLTEDSLGQPSRRPAAPPLALAHPTHRCSARALVRFSATSGPRARATS
ncbi:hypothetical protein FHY04_002810 [Sphingomonas sp. BK481]|nr:hypothetical protein [Sphingomonas sp. BK481]